VLEPTERARQREALLESVFRTYAALWDEALGIRFHSEMANVRAKQYCHLVHNLGDRCARRSWHGKTSTSQVLRTKTGAVAKMKDMAAELHQVRASNAELQVRTRDARPCTAPCIFSQASCCNPCSPG
jgi:hypothetical protein